MKDSDAYLFSPQSEMWRINRKCGGLLFGPAAVILQIAHPRVAQGVADHSDFQNDALGRLRRTLKSVNTIAFGTIADAERMREHLARVHGRVRGLTSEGIQGPPAYSAFEPDLLLWVLATLIDASIQGYEFAFGSLSHDRREAFYQDFRTFGTYFGLPQSAGPANYPAFERYFDAMLGDAMLGSHRLCAEVAAAVVHPRGSSARSLAWKTGRFHPYRNGSAAHQAAIGALVHALDACADGTVSSHRSDRVPNPARPTHHVSGVVEGGETSRQA